MITDSLLVFDSDGEQCTYNGYDYNTLHSMSKHEDYREFVDTSLVGDLGNSPLGYKVIVIIPAITNYACLNPEKSIRYAISKLHSVTKNPYALIICQTCAFWTDSHDFYFAKTWFDLLPRDHKLQLKKAYIIHSGYTVSTLMSLGSPLNGNASDKIIFLDKLSDALLQLDIKTKDNIRYFPYVVQRYEEIIMGLETPVTVFGSDFNSLCVRFGKPFKGLSRIPPFLSKLIKLLESQPCVTMKQLFDIQSDAPTLYGFIGDIESQGERVLTPTNIPALVYSFRLLLDSQYGGIMGPSSYHKLKLLGENPSDEFLENSIKNLISSQSIDHMSCVYLIILLFENLLKYSKTNELTLNYLGELFGGSFFRPHTPDPCCSKYIKTATRAITMMVKNKVKLFESLGIDFSADLPRNDTETFENVTFSDSSSSSSYTDSDSSHTDSGSGSESYSGSDTGSGSESYSGSDTGSGSESYSGSDTGSGSESYSGSDIVSGSGSNTGTYSETDSGTGSESNTSINTAEKQARKCVN